ncbi:MAG TPA: exodeoxyribonuclease VII large subunit, partial [Blastocatellia bacterium]|nr:exodeoxyribonuclease VII large subunit [Blastocatellia bacterium]
GAIKTRRATLSDLALRLSRADLRRAMIETRGRLHSLTARLGASVGAAVDHRAERMSIAAGKLASLSPLAVLARGYAIAFDARGRVIKRAVDVNSGDRVNVRVSEGDFTCVKE